MDMHDTSRAHARYLGQNIRNKRTKILEDVAWCGKHEQADAGTRKVLLELQALIRGADQTAPPIPSGGAEGFVPPSSGPPGSGAYVRVT